MPNPSQAATNPIESRTRETESPPAEYPVREYIGAMALELAQMARFDDDEPLAVMLTAVADRAAVGRRTVPIALETGSPIKRPS